MHNFPIWWARDLFLAEANRVEFQSSIVANDHRQAAVYAATAKIEVKEDRTILRLYGPQGEALDILTASNK